MRVQCLWSTFVCVAVIAATGCNKEEAKQASPSAASASGAGAAAARDKANDAIARLATALGDRLLAEMVQSGPGGAAKVCRDQALAITDAVGVKSGVIVGRTSHKLRNPKNAPRPWVVPYLKAARGKKASEVDSVTVDLGERVGVLRPIGVAPRCLACHGPPEKISPKVVIVLRESYPDDQAVGFAEGDFRGFFWAEATRASQ